MKFSIYMLIIVEIFLSNSTVSLAQMHHEPSDSPAIHGMLLFGSEKIYLSHLPMFHSPHNYQVILEAELSPEAKETYLQTKKLNPNESIYTFVPKAFVLPNIISQVKQLKGFLYKGHFERGGTLLVKNIDLEIKKVIYFNKFQAHQVHPKAVQYIYFGTENELFGAHLITAKPDFDHIVEVGASTLILDLLQFQPYIKVEFPELTPQTPVKPGSSPTSSAINESGPIEIDPYKLGKEIYLEYNDLSF